MPVEADALQAVRCPVCAGSGTEHCGCSTGDPWGFDYNPCNCSHICSGCSGTGKISGELYSVFARIREEQRIKYEAERITYMRDRDLYNELRYQRYIAHEKWLNDPRQSSRVDGQRREDVLMTTAILLFSVGISGSGYVVYLVTKSPLPAGIVTGGFLLASGICGTASHLYGDRILRQKRLLEEEWREMYPEPASPKIPILKYDDELLLEAKKLLAI